MWPFSNTVSAAIIAEKRAERARALQDVNIHVTEDQTKYLRATAAEIVAHIQAGEWTASDVLEAYISRAAYAHAQTNCLTEILFDRGRQTAKELDAYFAETGKLKGPLHGVPVSIKEHFSIAGADTTDGYTAWANQPEKTSSDIVDIVLAAGAIPYVKTNIPQALLSFECSNPIWGRTTNPYNKGYSSGGSSGGEAVLLSMDGSPLGIGTDAGGSLRIPAGYCGVYSLKPALGRISFGRVKPQAPGYHAIQDVAGPMGRSVEDLEIICRASFGVQGSNHDIPPIPYRDVKLPTKLKFGYVLSDNFIKSSPACRRAVLETVESLRKQGHECIEIAFPEVGGVLDVYIGALSSDGFKTMLAPIGSDPLEETIYLPTVGVKLPSFLRKTLAWAIRTFLHDHRFAGVFRQIRVKSVDEYWALVHKRDAMAKQFYEEVWDRYGIDSIIAPIQAVPQLPNGGCVKFSGLGVSTVLYNVTDMPVGCLPVTRVDADKDQVTEEWIKGPGHGSPIIEDGLYYAKDKLYDPKSCGGMPIGIQLVGKKWEEEKVLTVMKVVDEALGPRGFGPGSWEDYGKKVKDSE